MYCIYVIYNKKHDKFYIGQTKDFEVRLRMHNDGVLKSGYTARFDGEWRLIYQEQVSDRGAALLREK